MIENNFTVDNIDVFSNYGVYLAENSYRSIIEFAPAKKVKFNDWHEDNGIEMDYQEIKLDKKEIKIKIFSKNGRKGIIRFIELLSRSVYHTFCFFGLGGRTYKLRLLSQRDTVGIDNLYYTYITLMDDFPFDDNYQYIPPISTMPENTNYTIGGRILSDYGITVLDGTINNINGKTKIKQNLSQNLIYKNGINYDAGIVSKDRQDTQLYLLMRCDSVHNFWRNYDAFLHDICRNSVISFWTAYIHHVIGISYKSSIINEFFVYEDGKVWVKFTLNVTLI